MPSDASEEDATVVRGSKMEGPGKGTKDENVEVPGCMV